MWECVFPRDLAAPQQHAPAARPGAVEGKPSGQPLVPRETAPVPTLQQPRCHRGLPGVPVRGDPVPTPHRPRPPPVALSLSTKHHLLQPHPVLGPAPYRLVPQRHHAQLPRPSILFSLLRGALSTGFTLSPSVRGTSFSAASTIATGLWRSRRPHAGTWRSWRPRISFPAHQPHPGDIHRNTEHQRE